MEIKVEMVEELDDGSAIVTVHYDKEAHKFLIQQGVIYTIKEALEMEKKQWKGLKYGMKCTLGRWRRKLLKGLGLDCPSQKSEKQFKPYPTTLNTGNSKVQKKSTSHTRQHGSTKVGQMTKSTLPQKKSRSQNSLGTRQTNLPSKKAGN